MIGDKVKYTCKPCGWTISIREEWVDLKPKRCMNKKCNTSFMKFKDALIIELPEDLTEQESEKKSIKKRIRNS